MIDLDLDLGQEIDDVLGAAIELGVALLAAEALDFGHGEAGDADLRQRFAHLVELERLDDGFDFFHGGSRRDAQGARCALAYTNDMAPSYRHAAPAATSSHSCHADVIG